MKSIFFFIISISTLLVWSSCTHEVIQPVDPPGGQPSDSIPDLPPLVSDCDDDSVYYENTIAPLLSSSCGSSVVYCHNGPTDDNDETDLSSWAAIYYSNEDLVIPGDPNESKLIDEINDGDMPPDTSSFSITSEQAALLATWIQQGAQDNGCNEGCDTTNVSFQDDVFPIVSLYCTSCHSGSDPDGGVLLTNYSNISSEAVSGTMLDAINWTGSIEPMPYQADQLPECYINLIQIWVDNGALDN